MSKVSEGTRRAREAAGEKLEKVTGALRETGEQARARVTDAYESTRRSAVRAGERTADGIEHNPLAVLIGGLTLGAIAGALIPATRREAKALGGVGKRIRSAAGEAAGAAKAAGIAQLDVLGINGEAAKAQASKLVQSAFEAATSASRAAVDAAKAKTKNDA